MAKNSSLGKGISNLFSDNKLISEMTEEEINEIQYIEVDDIVPNPFQPRKNFDEEKLKELSKSIKEQGVFQPILVRSSLVGYELISGERRLRAAKLANLNQIPAIVYDYNDETVMEIALIENIQREDLSIVEEAKSLNMMLENLELTQEQLAKKIGKSRSYIANVVRILKLDNDVLDLMDTELLTLGHVKVLISIEDKNIINEIVSRIISEKLSVRETEKIVKAYKKPSAKQVKKITNSKRNSLLETTLREKFDTYVKVSGENNGKIEISFSSIDELERLIGELGLG